MKLIKKISVIFLSIALSTSAAMCANVVIEAAQQQINVDKNKGYFSNGKPKSKKPSLAVFFDNPYAFQDKDNKKHEIKANIMKVSLINKTLRAEGHTQSIMMKDRQPVVTITSDIQEYNTVTKLMQAKGSVIVHYQDVETFSDSASAIIDKGGEIQNLKLMGNVVMKEKIQII